MWSDLIQVVDFIGFLLLLVWGCTGFYLWQRYGSAGAYFVMSKDFPGVLHEWQAKVIAEKQAEGEESKARIKDSETAHQAYIASPEYKERVKRDSEEQERKRSARMVETAQTEKEMRDAKDPWPLTMAQLTEYIESLTKRGHDYGTCCYAMTLAATAAFNFVASELGVTAFQASCADLDFLRRSRGIKGPFMIIKADDALFPQCDPREKLAEALSEWEPWLKEQAQEKLSGNGELNAHTHPNVLNHWKMLAER